MLLSIQTLFIFLIFFIFSVRKQIPSLPFGIHRPSHEQGRKAPCLISLLESNNYLRRSCGYK